MTPGFAHDVESYLPPWVVHVNHEGRRFIDEATEYSVLSEVLSTQTAGECFAIFDEAARAEAKDAERRLRDARVEIRLGTPSSDLRAPTEPVKFTHCSGQELPRLTPNKSRTNPGQVRTGPERIPDRSGKNPGLSRSGPDLGFPDRQKSGTGPEKAPDLSGEIPDNLDFPFLIISKILLINDTNFVT